MSLNHHKGYISIPVCSIVYLQATRIVSIDVSKYKCAMGLMTTIKRHRNGIGLQFSFRSMMGFGRALTYGDK
jgi:hypothetical protein